MTSQDTFVVRLRRHRERQRISLDDIASATRVKRELLEAFERAGGTYYPKLQVSVPFTPVTGPRLLVRPDTDVPATRGISLISR